MPEPTRMSPQRAVVLLIAGTALLRLLFAGAVGLGMDESYMVVSGRVLSLGYFDHPPAAWWLSWGATWLAGGESALVVRLPFIALFALSTWLMFRLTAHVADARAGFWAAVLLNLSPVFGVTTGTWVLPDGPLDCALLGAALCLVHALPARGQAAWGWWSGAGVCAGLALFSKYSAVLTIAGAVVYVLIARDHRAWLRRPHPYLAALLAVLVFSPVILWNATHGWASFAFQGDRAVGLRFQPLAPLQVLLGEALFVLPWIWLPMMVLFVAALMPRQILVALTPRRISMALTPRRIMTAAMPPRRVAEAVPPGLAAPDWQARLLACLAAPPIVGFALIAAWSSRRILFHWAAPGYLMLFPLLGQALSERRDSARVRRSVAATAGLILIAVSVVGLQTRFDILGSALTFIARQDPTLEGIDWTSLHTDLTARGLLPPGTVVGVPSWRDAGKIGFGLGPEVTVLCLHQDARQFGFAHPPVSFVGRDLLILVVGDPAPAETALSGVFERIERLDPAPISLRGRVLHQVSVMRGHRLLRWPPP